MAGSVLAFEVVLGSGVLAAWIIAIYAGLLWFRHLAGGSQPTQREWPSEAPRPQTVTRRDRATGRAARGGLAFEART